jgi:hypothetical protein
MKIHWQSDFSSGAVTYRSSFHCPFARDSRWCFNFLFLLYKLTARMRPSCIKYVVHLVPNTYLEWYMSVACITSVTGELPQL